MYFAVKLALQLLTSTELMLKQDVDLGGLQQLYISQC